MNREFLRHYERELAYLYDHAEEFAQQYPGIAERLGGLSREAADPGITGLMEGSAFLTARVQMKLDSQFFEFTAELLEHLLPGLMSPTPSCALLETIPEYGDRNLAQGKHFPAGSYVDATYLERERNVSCRFRLATPLSIFPLHLKAAQYHSSAAALQALGLEVGPDTRAGLSLSIRHRASPLPRGKEKDADEGAPISLVEADTLPIYLSGTDIDTVALYEQIFAQCGAVWLRWQDEFETPHFMRLSPTQIDQVGFDDDELLAPQDTRQFPGFTLLRDFFAFPQKFGGFRLSGLRPLLQRIPVPEFDILFEFDKPVSRLQAAVKPSLFHLFAAPAANLFEHNCSRIPIRRNEHEHPVVPDRSRWIDYEVHHVQKVFAHYHGVRGKTPVYPIYRLPIENVRAEEALYFATRRLARRRTDQERKFGTTPEYMGSDVFLTLTEPTQADDERTVRELSVRAICSNRHLPAQLPIGETGADFVMVDDTRVAMRCISGPTPPRDSVVTLDRLSNEGSAHGSVLWRLINFLNFNHLGLSKRDGSDPANGLREVLALFGDLSDSVVERRIRGIVSVDTRPIVRRLRQSTGFNAARGIEITVTFDEKAFEGSGIMMWGAVLDRFFAQYSTINSFTETVVRSTTRGVVKRWPARTGLGQVL